MPNIFPFQIAQVNDFSHNAGAKLVDLMGKPETSTANILSKMLNMHTAASESQKMTDTIDAFRKAIESGKGFNDAVAGLDPRMTGSAEFQNRANDIHRDLIARKAEARAQAQFDDARRDAALQREAMGIRAEFEDYVNQKGPDAGFLWLQGNKDKYMSNPYAHQAINSAIAARGIDARPTYGDGTLTWKDPESIKTDILASKDNLQTAQRELAALQAQGYLAGLSPEEAQKRASLQNFIDEQAKLRGYTDGSYEDFYKNMQDGFAQLKAAALREGIELPDEVILSVMKQHMTAPLLWFEESSVDVSPAIRRLQAIAPTYERNRQKAEQLANVIQQTKEPIMNNQIRDQYDSYQAELVRVLQNPTLTSREKALMSQRLLSKFVTGNAVLTKNLKDLSDLANLYKTSEKEK